MVFQGGKMKNKVLIAAVAAVLGLSTAKAAPLYECHGDPSCQAKRDSMSRATYDRNIRRCLASAGATIEQWRAHAVPRGPADKVRACLAANG
ncbi:hypothetical protein ACVIW2_000696 [Bradyrhizobium huanghuaihaiense]|uniref:Cysteine rich repeat protein n=1 Tax=Bradyrhizobium huanghuaihaiense TaxID=990078 RepID=A0A562RYA2_9BRAD|nr:hypothetical protein IQ16_01542 [Bradyrhizobium huanghuaihaiense]